MTSEQKSVVTNLRRTGMKYTEIAQTLGLPVTTVKSFCYKNKIDSEEKPQQPVCAQCDAVLPPTRYRPRRFCSDACRHQFWTLHQEDLNRKATVPCTCQQCGKQFSDYAQRSRKYCSHQCYIIARYGGEAHE